MRRRLRVVIAPLLLVLAACGGGGGNGADLRGSELGIVIPDPGGTDPGTQEAVFAETPAPDADDPGGVPPDSAPNDPDVPADPGLVDPGLADPGTPDPGSPDVPSPVDPGPADADVKDAGCTADKDCGPGMACLNYNCLPCNWDDKCGSTCSPCKAPTPHCLDGECVVCAYGAECGAGQFCDHGACAECGQDDPLHCGSDCEPCIGQYPSCVAGECTCTDASCGPGLRCLGGKCSKCETADACGESCAICADPNPHCVQGACAFCIDDSKCPEDQHCSPAGACVPDCLVTDGCATDEAPDGKACGKARTIGRLAALAGYSFSGDTANASDKDNLSTNDTDCWDAGKDNYFRIWLVAGDILDVILTPKSIASVTWDSMMKIYTGTLCDGQGALPINCYDTGGEGGKDYVNSFIAPADGWYTIVVDGRTSVSSQWLPYLLTVKLACKMADCCCPGV